MLKNIWNFRILFTKLIKFLTSSSSSTTTSVNFFDLKSSRVIFGQKNKPIFVEFSKTRIPVGVRPRWYSLPSLPCKQINED